MQLQRSSADVGNGRPSEATCSAGLRPSGLSASTHQICHQTCKTCVKACTNSDPEGRPASFAEIADTIERASPACLRWGWLLWQQQQAYFESATHAQKLSSRLCMQGLQVLLSQRQQAFADRQAEADALQLLANQYLSYWQRH